MQGESSASLAIGCGVGATVLMVAAVLAPQYFVPLVLVGIVAMCLAAGFLFAYLMSVVDELVAKSELTVGPDLESR